MGFRTLLESPKFHGIDPHISLLGQIKSEILFGIFNKMFDVVHADTPELIEQAHRMRYQVFCEEHEGYEDRATHPDGMEKDKYDSHSLQALLVYKPRNIVMGTIRVITANPDDWRNSFPLQNLISAPQLHTEAFVKNACELSRFCISREVRKTIKAEIQQFSSRKNNDPTNPFNFFERPLLNIALAISPMGLIRGAFELALKKGILNVFGVMEPFHIARLEMAGLLYTKLSEEIEYHGKRLPFICNIMEYFDHAISFNHNCWKIISNNRKNHQRAIDIHERKQVMTH